MERRGDLTSTQIIMLIIAVVGFGIVLLALFLVDFGGYSEKDICKLSVLTRATSPDITQAAFPLKCKSEKICITDKVFGGCEDQFAGEQDVVRMRVSGDKKTEIEKITANAMFDCWSMMGEGKLDIFTKATESLGWSKTQPTCVICSRIAVDKDIQGVDLNAIDVNSYMKTHQVPGSSLTYLQTFTDRGVSSYANVGGQLSASEYNKLGQVKLDSTYEQKVEAAAQQTQASQLVVNRELAIVFMQMKPPSVDTVLNNLAAAGVTLGAATFMSPVGKFASRVVFTPVGAAIAIGTAAAVGGYGAYNAHQGQLAAATYCGAFSSNSDKTKSGCSMVQGLNYNFKEINAVCANIEGEI